ncbi:hypothetical protein [Chromobacterium subtsugae]|uniref:hypothetical protein n=1 Tax=Chromobacterium subtsugae TaxID=251747 RepID=UPI000640E223|nr:hypothetical protein [Chromobacterium subtsugae]
MSCLFPATLPGVLALCALLASLLERALVRLLLRFDCGFPWFELCGFGIAYLMSLLLWLYPMATLLPALLPLSLDAVLAALLIIGLAGLLRHGRTLSLPAPCSQPHRACRLSNLTASPYHSQRGRRP